MWYIPFHFIVPQEYSILLISIESVCGKLICCAPFQCLLVDTHLLFHDFYGSRYGDRLRSLGSDTEASFVKYLTEDVAVDGGFLLPSAANDNAVTAYTTFVHGGSQYAVLVKYVAQHRLHPQSSKSTHSKHHANCFSSSSFEN